MVRLTFHNLCCCSYTDMWMGRDMHNSSGHIDHATTARGFVDQTQHVKNAFCFCMLTLMACVNKTWQRRDIRNSYMFCQKTTASDEAIVCWYLHSYLDKWIQEFQEDEEYSAANGGQRHPKRNKGKGKHISWMSLQYYMLSEKKIQAARSGLEIPNDWDQGDFSEAIWLYNEERKG